MAPSVTLLHAKGIPVRLHLTFLLVLPVFAYLMARAYFTPEGGFPDTMGWVWGSLLAIGLFASVLLHEFSHSFMAMREGIKVQHITLLPIGGVSAFEEIPREPGKEFRITIVGPITNFVLGAPLLALAYSGLVGNAVPGLERFLFSLGALNIAIGAFNLLLPAFPMDGGRILRASLTPALGRVRATRVASVVGQGIAVLMAGFGILTFSGGGWLLLIIALFVFMGARGEEDATRLMEALEHHRVGELMTSHVDTIPADTSIEDALLQMLRTRHVVLPVVEPGGHVVGVAHFDDLRQVPPVSAPVERVDRVMRAQFATARPEDDASELGRLLTGADAPVLVLRRDDLVGIVTATDVARFTQLATAAGARRGARAG